MSLFACDKIGLQFPGRPARAFSCISLAIETGDCLHITGPSGAGKTSLMRVIAGLTKPTSGHIIARPKRIGMAFAEPRLIGGLSVLDNLRFVAPRAASEAEALLEALDIAALADTPASSLSKGQAQRAALVRALLVHPEILLLDEALSGLDQSTWTLARDQIEAQHFRESMAIVEITHDVSRTVSRGGKTLQLS
ncbi:MAG: ATP-binding cassette domain-containing protein [Pannonibacter phragmitetus]